MSSPLIVPVKVRALYVNDAESQTTFQRWNLHQSNMSNYVNRPLVPYPLASTAKPKKPAVYLHWLLPEAVRTTRPDPQGGDPTLPPAPNRWLIVRFFQPGNSASQLTVSKAQIVNSDEMKGTSNYVVPDSNQNTGFQGARIGKSYPAASWQEPTESLVIGNSYPPLTAVGPGLVDFAAYQPYNENVFSYCDDLNDVKGSLTAGTLDYLVVGWNARTEDDLLVGSEDLNQLMADLGWKADDGAGDIERRSLYAGTALRLTNPPYSNWQMPQSTGVKIAAGSNTPEAQTALASKGYAAEKRLLQAYLTQNFDQLERDAAGLDTRTDNSFFTQHVEGYLWDITDTDSETPPPDEKELETEREWLQQLNADQKTYDTAGRMAAGLRQRLYDLWRVSQIPDSGYDQSTYNQKINAVADALNTQLTTMANLIAGGLPSGDTEAALAQSISAYEQKKNLPASRALKRSARKGFYSPNDPVLLFSGLDAPDPFEAPAPLPCRTLSQAITSMKVGGTMHDPFDWGDTPDLSWSASLPDPVKGAVKPLIEECALLAFAAATGQTAESNGLTQAMAAWAQGDTSYFSSGSYPATFTQCWQQPWTPSYLLWRIYYYPLPLAGAGSTDYPWQFDAETKKRYVLTKQGNPGPVTAQILSGYARLSPMPQGVANAAAEQHARLYPDAPLTALTELAASGQLGEISQNLESFNLSLLQRIQAGNAVPPPAQKTPDNKYSYFDLLGGPPRYASPLPDPTVREGKNPNALAFQNGLRSGQFVLQTVQVVDTFGRTLELDPAGDKFFIGDSLTPDSNLVVGKDIPADLYLQLRPRIIQPIQLNFDFTSATDKNQVIGLPPVVPTQSNPALSPVIGWVFLDRSSDPNDIGVLRVYDPAGKAVVTARPALAPDNTTGVNWDPLPGGYGDIDHDGGDLHNKCPELYAFLKGIRAGSPDARYRAFVALAAHVDHTALAVNPANAGDMLSQLNGRAAALLHARLCLGIDTYPLGDTSLKNLPNFTPPPYLADDSWRFNILLGRDDLFADGLIGYYTHPPKNGKQGNPVDTTQPIDYTLLRTVDYLTVDDSTSYIRRIDAKDLALPVNQADATSPVIAELILLADPWHTITATSDIQPTAVLQLDDDQARAPLSNAHLAFPVGPLLTSTRPAEDTGDLQIVMPQPAGWTGHWKWAERTPNNDDWNYYPISPPDAVPHLDETPPTTRTGYLVMTQTLEQAQQQALTIPPPNPTPPTTPIDAKTGPKGGAKAGTQPNEKPRTRTAKSTGGKTSKAPGTQSAKQTGTRQGGQPGKSSGEQPGNPSGKPSDGKTGR
ncbi:hypothetical protein [Streptomyces violascens]|uniref:hypothetical protein n=1 Tax=Streptomyces violascens TaxID=67381 RepID=UPI0036B4E0AC